MSDVNIGTVGQEKDVEEIGGASEVILAGNKLSLPLFSVYAE